MSGAPGRSIVPICVSLCVPLSKGRMARGDKGEEAVGEDGEDAGGGVEGSTVAAGSGVAIGTGRWGRQRGDPPLLNLFSMIFCGASFLFCRQ